MFDDPYDIDCSRCKADLDEPCVDAMGNEVAGFHVERLNAIALWNRFFKKGDFNVAPLTVQREGDEA